MSHSNKLTLALTVCVLVAGISITGIPPAEARPEFGGRTLRPASKREAAGLEQLERQLRVESLPANAGLESQEEDVLWEGPYSDLQETIEDSLPDWRDQWNERGILTSRFVVVFPEQIAEEGDRGILRLLDRKDVTAKGKPERIARAIIRALEEIFEPSELADMTFQIVRTPGYTFVEVRPIVAKADLEGAISYKRWIQRDQEDVEFPGIATTDRPFRVLSKGEAVHLTIQQLKDFQFLHLINESVQGDYLLLFPFNSQGVMIAVIPAGTVSPLSSYMDLQSESYPLFFPRVIASHLEESGQSLEGFLNEVTVHGIHFQTNPQGDIFIQSAGEGNIYLEVFRQAGLEGVQIFELPSAVYLYAEGQAMASGLEARLQESDLRGAPFVVRLASERHELPGVIIDDLMIEGMIDNPLGLPVEKAWLADVRTQDFVRRLALALVKALGIKYPDSPIRAQLYLDPASETWKLAIFV